MLRILSLKACQSLKLGALGSLLETLLILLKYNLYPELPIHSFMHKMSSSSQDPQYLDDRHTVSICSGGIGHLNLIKTAGGRLVRRGSSILCAVDLELLSNSRPRREMKCLDALICSPAAGAGALLARLQSVLPCLTFRTPLCLRQVCTVLFFPLQNNVLQTQTRGLKMGRGKKRK